MFTNESAGDACYTLDTTTHRDCITLEDYTHCVLTAVTHRHIRARECRSVNWLFGHCIDIADLSHLA